MNQRFSEYRIMWILVFYDLPTETRLQRKRATTFRKDIMADGFTMFQFSAYIRHCASRENADVHEARVKAMIPEEGHVGILTITDKQFGEMKIFHGVKSTPPPRGGIQLELF